MSADPEHARSRVRDVIALVITGAVGGFLSGAFGVGGGVIMMPLLLWLTRFDHRRAAATSLAAIVPTAVAGGATYLAAGHVDLLAGLLVAAGGVAGSLIGTRLLRALPLGWLRWGFVALLLVIAVRMFLVIPASAAAIDLNALTMAGLVLLGLAMGVAAGLFGIGGGVLAVPVLIAVFGAGDLFAKGTSLLAMIPTAATGTVANAQSGLVRLSDGLVIGLAATAASFGGAAIAFLISPGASSILFAILILLIAAQVTVHAIRQQRGPSEGETPGDA